MDSDEANAVPGTEGVALVGPSFSPDGRWLVFTARGALKKVPVDGAPRRYSVRDIVGVGSRGTWGATT